MTSLSQTNQDLHDLSVAAISLELNSSTVDNLEFRSKIPEGFVLKVDYEWSVGARAGGKAVVKEM